MLDIRAAQPSDAAAISKLVSALVAKFIAPDCTPAGAEILLKSMSAQAIAGYISQPNVDYQLATLEGELVAVVATRDNSHLYHLFVAEAYQGRGYARLLWQQAKERCIARAATKVFTVNASLYAEALYRRLGFVAMQGRREQQGIVDVPMQLTLDVDQP